MGGGTFEVINGVKIGFHSMTEISFLGWSAQLGVTLLIATLFSRDLSPVRTAILPRTRCLPTMVPIELAITRWQNSFWLGVPKSVLSRIRTYITGRVLGINGSQKIRVRIYLLITLNYDYFSFSS